MAIQYNTIHSNVVKFSKTKNNKVKYNEMKTKQLNTIQRSVFNGVTSRDLRDHDERYRKDDKKIKLEWKKKFRKNAIKTPSVTFQSTQSPSSRCDTPKKHYIKKCNKKKH